MPALTPELTPQLHAILSAFVRERLGIHYRPEDRELIADRLGMRALEAGFESLLDYYYHLRYDDPDGVELSALADALVVNESYFFREYEALAMIAARFIAPAIERGERPRVWSAACAAGEEPLSLAMILSAQGLLDRTELVASDLSERVLARRRGGVWSARALRRVPDPTLVERFMTVEPDGRVRVAAALHEAIQWRRLNLIEPLALAATPACDVILCRNVLIYFDDETVRQVVAALAERLVVGGILLIGISESLLRFGVSLRCEEHDGVFYYRKVQ